MKHLGSVSKKPALAGSIIDSISGPWGWGPAFWTPAVFGFQINELGDLVYKWSGKASDIVQPE